MTSDKVTNQLTIFHYSGVFGREMTMKTREAIQTRGLNKMGKCQFGLVIDINKDEGCFGLQKDTKEADLKRVNKEDPSSFPKVSVEIKNIIWYK